MNINQLINPNDVPTRRPSESEGRKQSLVGTPEIATSRKRTRSPSESENIQSEPSPKRLKPKKQRPTEVPMWAKRWTKEWQNQFGGRNGYIVKAHPDSPSHATPPRAPPLGPPPTNMPQKSSPAPAAQQIPVRPSTAVSDRPPGRVEHTYTNIRQLDELTRRVMDFLFYTVIDNGLIESMGPGMEIEVEAKLGTIVNKNTEDRIDIPVANECVLMDGRLPIAFRSSMTEKQHQHMNEHLNKAVQASLGTKGRAKMKYVHTRETDTFYQCPEQFIREMPPKILERVREERKPPRVRLSKDQKTGRLLASIVKVRLADLHVFNPRMEHDWRVSISCEMHYPGDVSSLQPAQDSGRAKHGRDKDRLSYEHQDIKIDLTQVTMEGSKEHELEFELPFLILRDEASKMRKGAPSTFRELIENFVDDIRIATREFPC